MLEDFLMDQMEDSLVGFDDHLQMLMGDVMLTRSLATHLSTYKLFGGASGHLSSHSGMCFL